MEMLDSLKILGTHISICTILRMFSAPVLQSSCDEFCGKTYCKPGDTFDLGRVQLIAVRS